MRAQVDKSTFSLHIESMEDLCMFKSSSFLAGMYFFFPLPSMNIEDVDLKGETIETYKRRRFFAEERGFIAFCVSLSEIDKGFIVINVICFKYGG